ncbi:MAG TPA: amidohydrolase family protein, partial [bacterium]|nr:amidohydrolase family protein [bacterium]
AAAGAVLAFGSDSPVETMDPLAGIHAAVTRQDATGQPAEGWHADERITPEAAVGAYTWGAAQAARAEGTGRIAAGCHGDFVMLTHDLFAESDPMRILDARVALTVVGGEIVYGGGG